MAKSISKTKKKVMVVEDDKFLVRALTTKLKKEGFEVELLTNGAEALNTIRTFKPDILLLDLMMPKVDGFTVLEELRADEALKDMPVLVLSNLGQEPDTNTTKKLGVLEHLVKSDTPLATIIERIKFYAK